MYLNSEVLAALDTAKLKIAEHTRQAAVDLSSANALLTAAVEHMNKRRLSIRQRRAELDEEERQVEAQFEADIGEISVQVLTIKRGMRDDDGTGGLTLLKSA